MAALFAALLLGGLAGPVVGSLDSVAGVVGRYGQDGEGGPADTAKLYRPYGLAWEPGAEVLYVADEFNSAVRRWNRARGTLDTAVGVLGRGGSSGDGGSARSARLRHPRGLAWDASAGVLYIADNFNHAVRRWSQSSGTLDTVAGVLGSSGSSGDGGQGSKARLHYPNGLAWDSGGGVLYIADCWNHAVRRWNAASGILDTVAGQLDRGGCSGDEGPGTTARLDSPEGLAWDAEARVLYISDRGNHVVRRWSPTTGMLSTAVGILGDTSHSPSTRNWSPSGLAWDAAAGALYITERSSSSILRWHAALGTVDVVAGPSSHTGEVSRWHGFVDVKLHDPAGLAWDPRAKTLYVVDSGDHVVQRWAAEVSSYGAGDAATTTTTLSGSVAPSTVETDGSGSCSALGVCTTTTMTMVATTVTTAAAAASAAATEATTSTSGAPATHRATATTVAPTAMGATGILTTTTAPATAPSTTASATASPTTAPAAATPTTAAATASPATGATAGAAMAIPTTATPATAAASSATRAAPPTTEAATASPESAAVTAPATAAKHAASTMASTSATPPAAAATASPTEAAVTATHNTPAVTMTPTVVEATASPTTAAVTAQLTTAAAMSAPTTPAATPTAADSSAALIEADIANASRTLVQLASDAPGAVVRETTQVARFAVVAVTPESAAAYMSIADEVLVPVDLFGSNETVVVVIARLSPAYLATLHAQRAIAGDVSSMVAVFVHSARSERPLEASAHSILLKLTDTAEAPSGTCVHLDGDTWSTDGVRRASTDELTGAWKSRRAANVSLGGVWCASKHLSVFAFCPATRSRGPVVFFFCLLTFLGLTHAAALSADRRHQHTGLWSEQCFLTQRPLKTSPFAFAPVDFASVLHNLPHWSLALLIRCRLVAECGLSQSALHDHVYSDKGFVLGGAAGYASKELGRRIAGVREVPSEVLRGCFGRRGLLRRARVFLRAFHPLLTLGDAPIQLSCAKNAKLVSDSLLAGLAVQALLLSGESPFWLVMLLTPVSAFLGGLPARALVCCIARNFAEGCGDAQQLLSEFAQRDLAFWAGGLGYSLLLLAVLLLRAPPVRVCAALLLHALALKPLVVSLALATLTGVVARNRPELVQRSNLALGTNLEGVRNAEEVLAELDELGRATVKSLARRGISVAHLLDFYQKLGCLVMPHFDAAKSTTEDVVRQAIIPLSRQCAEQRFGRPLRLQLGTVQLKDPLSAVVFCRCEVVGRPEVSLETWPLVAHGLKQLDWGLEAEMPGYREGDALKVSLLSEQGEEAICVGFMAAEGLAEQHEVFLDNPRGACLGRLVLRAIPPVQPTPEPTGVPDKRPRDWCCTVWSPRFVTGVAYATAVATDKPVFPAKMVTHNWTNCFAHLMACVFADALGCRTYNQVLQMLLTGNLTKLRAQLGAAGKLDTAYWICAFAVNQHMSICHKTPSMDSTGAAVERCICVTEKGGKGSASETNKLAYMMAYLKAFWEQRGKQFSQVIAVDVKQDLFTRVWCIAELHEAYCTNMRQEFMFHSSDFLDTQVQRGIAGLIDVTEAKATYEEDKRFILSKIANVGTFNEQVRCIVSYRLRTALSSAAVGNSLWTVLLDALLQ